MRQLGPGTFRRTQSSARGLTLVEVTTALGVVSIVMLGLTSAVMIAMRAMDHSQSSAHVANAGDALGQMQADLQLARGFSELSNHAISFTVPDRDSPPDGQEEIIRYAWSGAPGDPLTQRFNGGAAVPIVKNVHDLLFTSLTRSVTPPPAPPPDPVDPTTWGYFTTTIGGIVYEAFSEAKLASDGDRLTISKPPGTASGDLLIATVVTDSDNEPYLTPPAGWYEILRKKRGNAVTVGVWWKIAGAVEADSYLFTWAGNPVDPAQQAYGWIMRFSGHDPSDPIHGMTEQDIGSGVTYNPPAPTLSTSVDGALILRLGAFDDDDVTVNTPGLPGHDAITMDQSASGSGTCSGGAGFTYQPIAGTAGTSTFTLTDMEQAICVTIAIAPAAP